jgi:hypothetical protein
VLLHRAGRVPAAFSALGVCYSKRIKLNLAISCSTTELGAAEYSLLLTQDMCSSIEQESISTGGVEGTGGDPSAGRHLRDVAVGIKWKHATE